ncbi:MAG: type II toxin-antitoxin system VapC family toxin [Saprospiraceae bacterium]|nr:type II toxin-antitoxin system VapC family toxin [Saprospiraceae bacterium]
MDFLLDTHTLIWFLEGDNNLSKVVIDLLEDPQKQKHVSIVSIWEIAIKINIGKLEIKTALDQLPDFLLVNDFELLPLTIEHCLFYQKLPLHHRDPFDRLLIAQAAIENLTVLTKDSHFEAYSVPILW